MQKTKIEWCDYTWNPVKGLCPQACWYCYARAMYKRFKWNPKLRLNNNELYCRRFPQHGGRIFVDSTIDLFHPQIPSEWINKILQVIRNSYYAQEHTFIFLTKNPARYAEFDFPDNCWLGVTVTNQEESVKLDHLKKLSRWYKNSGNVVFASYEPLLGVIKTMPIWLNWVIIGALTGPKAKQHIPHRLWVDEMARGCRQIMIPLFLKNNLKAVWGEKLIQEFPERRKA